MTLLVLDKDLGFLFWLAKALEPCGHSIVPASTVSQANCLLWTLPISVDLLLINPALEGAAAFSDALRHDQPQLKVIALLEQEEKKSELSGVRADAMHAKPDLSADGSFETDSVRAENDWGRFVEKVAGNRTAGHRSNWEKLLVVRGRGGHPYLH